VPKTGVAALLDSRATDLKQHAGAVEAIDAFARMQPRNLTVPEVEIELPASADGIYAYAFTSVTGENVESPRSAVTFVAVPRRSTPGAPTLRVRAQNGQ